METSTYGESEKNCNLTSTCFMIIQLNVNRFKQNLQQIMLHNLTTTVQNLVRKFWKLTELLIIECLLLKTSISSISILL